jgi:hypothetical protein
VEQPPHPLLASELRVERAYAHMLELREALLQYIEDHRGLWTLTRDEKHDLRFVQVRPFPPLPPLPSILIGETIYNLRAALDYIVYTIACHATGKDVKGTQWPIEDDPDIFEGRHTGKHPKTGKRVAKWLDGLDAPHIQVIEEMQPFKSGQWARTLRELSNPDKHRTLTPFDAKGNVEYRGPDEIVWLPGQEEAEVDLKYRVALEFNISKMNLPLLPTLKLLHDEVALVVQLFKGFFVTRVVPQDPT